MSDSRPITQPQFALIRWSLELYNIKSAFLGKPTSVEVIIILPASTSSGNLTGTGCARSWSMSTMARESREGAPPN